MLGGRPEVTENLALAVPCYVSAALCYLKKSGKWQPFNCLNTTTEVLLVHDSPFPPLQNYL